MVGLRFLAEILYFIIGITHIAARFSFENFVALFILKEVDKMPYVSPEVIQEAKRMDLLTYLQSYDPQELVLFQGSTYTTRTHDSLKISNGKWMWWSRGIGGRSALDYLVKVRDMKFTDAVEHLAGRAAVMPPVSASMPQPKERRLILPPKYKHSNSVEDYLRRRGLDPEITRPLMEAGRIYENHNQTASGRVFVNAVFVGLDKGGTPRYASLRGIQSDFKGDAIGSDKRYSFSLPSDTKSSKLHLFESAIDLLSYTTILKYYGADWREDNLLSLAGIYQPKEQLADSKLPAALVQFLEDYPHVSRVVLHLDNDLPGRSAAEAIAAVMPREIVVENMPSPQGKDFNDFLRMQLAKKKEQVYAR